MEQNVQLDMNQLATAIGMKELELIFLRSQVQSLQTQVKALTPPPAAEAKVDSKK